MARLQGIEERNAGVIGRYLLGAARRIAGKLSDTWPIAARVPNLHRGWAMTEYFLDRSHLVERRLWSLASLKASLLIGCPT